MSDNPTVNPNLFLFNLFIYETEKEYIRQGEFVETKQILMN